SATGTTPNFLEQARHLGMIADGRSGRNYGGGGGGGKKVVSPPPVPPPAPKNCCIIHPPAPGFCGSRPGPRGRKLAKVALVSVGRRTALASRNTRSSAMSAEATATATELSAGRPAAARPPDHPRKPAVARCRRAFAVGPARQEPDPRVARRP